MSDRPSRRQLETIAAIVVQSRLERLAAERDAQKARERRRRGSTTTGPDPNAA